MRDPPEGAGLGGNGEGAVPGSILSVLKMSRGLCQVSCWASRSISGGGSGLSVGQHVGVDVMEAMGEDEVS